MGIIDYIFQRKKKKLKLSIAQKPIVKVPDLIFNQGFDALNDMLKYNIAPPLGDHSDIWTRPAPKFPGAYLWDSSFISQAWKIWDPTIGLRALKAFVDFQQPDGRMPHMVFWGKKVSELSNPPFLTWAVRNLLSYYPNQKFADFFIEPISNFMKWRKKARYNENAGLYYWKHSYESGIDNSPRFTSIDESEKYNVDKLGAIDLNSEIVLQHQAFLDLTEEFNQAHSYRNEAKNELQRLTDKVNISLWDKKRGIFGDLDFTSNNLKTIDTIASYFPLIFNKLPEPIKKKLLSSLEDPSKYNTKIPTPTVARNSEYFVKDMWRGPVWMNTSYLIVKGMERQGKEKLAADFAYRLCKGVYYTWDNKGHFYEFYDPERYDLKELNRKKGNFMKKITLGPKPVIDFAGWTADVNPLLIENIIGIKKEKGGWILSPHLPTDWMKLKGKMVKATLPFFDLDLQYIINSDQTTLEVDVRLLENSFKGNLSNHEKIKLDKLKK